MTAPVEPAPADADSVFEIRGRVVSRATGEPVACEVPAVVLATPEAGASNLPAKIHELWRVGETFSPPFLVVCVGDRVRISNKEEICHSFFSVSELNAFDVGLLKPRTSSTLEFQRAGPVRVYCKLHDEKKATILVAATRHFAVIGPSGEFTIGGLPAGCYVVEVWTEGASRPRFVLDVASTTELVEIPIEEADVQRAR